MTKSKTDNISIINIDIIRCSKHNLVCFEGLIKEIVSSGSRKVILNFDGCKYLDDSFLLSLLSLFKELALSEREIKFVAKNHLISHILKGSKINKIIEVFESLPEALGADNKSYFKEYSIKC